MFTLNSTHDRLKRELESFKAKHSALTIRWNELVARVNAHGGEAFLDGDVPHPWLKKEELQFTQDELRSLIQIVHPDRNGGSEVSTRLSKKINGLRN